MRDLPLVTDLDGTLIAGDSLWEGLLRLLCLKPWLLFLLPFWLYKGRLYLKYKVLPQSLEVLPSVATRTNLRPEVLALLEEARGQGRKIYLATAAPTPLAEALRARLGFFDGCWGSNEGLNLRGGEKAARLVAVFGEKGFDYIGDSRADLPVWIAARKAILAGSDPALPDLVRRLNPDYLVLPTPKAGWRDYPRCARMHQWSKNLLLGLPLLLAHAFSWSNLGLLLIAFISFSCCASAGYVLNDLLDLPADRLHPLKRLRPLASGLIPLERAPLFFGGLLAAAALTTLFQPPRFFLFLAGYCLLTFTYSLCLKKLLMADTLCLACLYLVRVAAGAAALDLPLSNWLSAFCIFTFLGLALIKRISEIARREQAGADTLPGRAYNDADKSVLEMMAACSLFSATVILALYIDSLQALELYARPHYLRLLCLLCLYWFGRALLLSARGALDEDPVQFVLRDKLSWAACCVGLAVIFLAI